MRPAVISSLKSMLKKGETSNEVLDGFNSSSDGAQRVEGKGQHTCDQGYMHTGDMISSRDSMLHPSVFKLLLQPEASQQQRRIPHSASSMLKPGVRIVSIAHLCLPRAARRGRTCDTTLHECRGAQFACLPYGQTSARHHRTLRLAISP